MLKFFAWPSVARNIQNRTCAWKNRRRSRSGSREVASSFMMSRMPGPPSDSYFRCGGVPVAWHMSSCGSRTSQACPSSLRHHMRSNRSTASTFMSSNIKGLVRATGIW
ncbi:hypothetical protein D3C72_1741040 [compost metagenome]